MTATVTLQRAHDDVEIRRNEGGMRSEELDARGPTASQRGRATRRPEMKRHMVRRRLYFDRRVAQLREAQLGPRWDSNGTSFSLILRFFASSPSAVGISA
jgi:hypothetical protein